MSNHNEEQPDPETSGRSTGEEGADPAMITDDQLPEDLRPTDDNPLAQSPEENPIGSTGKDDETGQSGQPDS